jgi:hypothetical protein
MRNALFSRITHYVLWIILMRKSLWKWLPVAAAVILLFAQPLLAKFPSTVESLYARGFYKLLAAVVSPVTGLLPFSLSELSIYLIAAGSVYWIVRGILRKRFWRALGELAIAGSVAVLWFYVFWGMNYFRQPLEVSLRLPEAALDSVAFRRHLEWSIAEANAGWMAVPEWSMGALDGEIEAGYRRVFTALDMKLTLGNRRPKTPLIPAILDYTLTSGIFGPWFHEVHLNGRLLPVELPFILAHEKAHQLGFAREGECNFLAALVCLTSPDPRVRYSGQFGVVGRARFHEFEGYDSLAATVRPEVLADFAAVRERVERYYGPVARWAAKWYDLYLRANQVEGGVENYDEVVDLMIRWREKNGGALLPP